MSFQLRMHEDCINVARHSLTLETVSAVGGVLCRVVETAGPVRQGLSIPAEIVVPAAQSGI